MDLTRLLLRGVGLAWMVLGFGGWILVDQGYTEPWLTFAAVPGGSVGAFAAVLVAVLAGWMVVGVLRKRHDSAVWQETGREAGLTPAGDGGFASAPELTGTVDGRDVSARYEVRRRGGGAEHATTEVTFTFGETDLAGPADEGVVVATAGDRISVEDGVGTLDVDDLTETASAADGLVAVETGDLVLVGTSEAAVEAVGGGLSGEALRAVADLQIASVGDAAGVVAGWAEARNEELEGSIVEFPVENLAGRVPGDAGTVTVETRASIRDGDDLRRFAEGVVAVADAFEEATARTPA